LLLKFRCGDVKIREVKQGKFNFNGVKDLAKWKRRSL
jgi:hypothetical protein